VGDRVGPALAGDVAAQVALAQQPRRQPIAPLQDLAAGQQRPAVVTGDALAQHQGREAAPEHRVRVALAEADQQPERHPVAQAAEEVVVDTPVQPCGERRVRRAVAQRGIGVAEHACELGGQVVERPVGRDREPVCVHLSPV